MTESIHPKAMSSPDTTEVGDSDAPRLLPQVSFESITFSDGSTLSLDEDDIIVFVGPNNAGKSAALRELEAWVARPHAGKIITSTVTRRKGTSDDLRKYLETHSLKTGHAPQITYTGMGYSIHQSHVSFFDNAADRHPIAPFFAKRLATETRIQDSGAAPAVALYQSPPSHPIHLLLMDEQLANSISEKFRHAFGKDLTVFRAGGGNFPLYVGTKPRVPAGKDELSREFVEALQKTNVPLDTQGDGMRSFAAVILHTLVAQNHSIQFLDEPEAFLHPPQARLLGKYIAEARRQRTQLFISTHSTDILDGLIEGGLDKVRLVRIRREGEVNHIKELGKEQTKAIAKDTLARYSRVFDGIFFEHVIICESDADCMFYQSILGLQEISGDRRPDVLFVHTSGKHRMGKLAQTLKALDVPVSVIPDIDVLNDEETFKRLVEVLRGEWEDIRPHWKAVSDAVINQRPPLNATQVAQMIQEQISQVSGTGEFPSINEKAIKSIFKSVSPWSALKQSGCSAVPSGEPTRQYQALSEKCSALGLWIVPVGEMEGFCRSIGSHGPGFVEKLLETRALGTDPELDSARTFIKKVWQASKPRDEHQDLSLG